MYNYIKHIIFDLDGVLIDSRELHYDALNKALLDISEEYVIKREEHLSTFDGKSTKTKLNLLTERKGLPVSTRYGMGVKTNIYQRITSIY